MALAKPGRPKEIKRRAILQVTVDAAVKEVLERIADREKTTVSKMLRPEIEVYAKAHASGNPGFALDKWAESPTFQPWPTAWQNPPLDQLKKMDTKELKQMKGHLDRWLYVVEKKLGARGE